jgi:tetratricopeptide (TPR) repeat protein
VSSPTATVFLASRFKEFADLRAVLRREITRAGYDLVDLNDDTSVPMTALNRSVERVKDADIVVLLLGTTYSEDNDPEYVSVTHREFLAAREAELPILAFSVGTGSTDQRLNALEEEVRKGTTIGRVHGGSTQDTLLDDTDRVLEAIAAWGDQLEAGDYGGDRVSFAEQLARDLNYLGLAGLGDWQMPQATLLANQKYAQLVEFRRLALRALEARDRAEARRLLTQGHTIYPYDWSTNFLLARLLETRGQNTDLMVAAKIIDQAVRALDQASHFDWAPQTLNSRSEMESRRRSATLDVVARIARRRRELDVALKAAVASLELNPQGQSALVELVRVHSRRGDLGEALIAAESLLALYPYRAVNLMRDADLEEVQPALERGLVAKVVERHRQARNVLTKPGERSDVPNVERLSKALTHYRSYVSDYRSTLSEATSLLAKAVSTQTLGDASLSTLDGMVAHLERQLAQDRRAATAKSVKRASEGDLAAASAQMWESDLPSAAIVAASKERRDGTFFVASLVCAAAIACMYLSHVGTAGAIVFGLVVVYGVRLSSGSWAIGIVGGVAGIIGGMFVPSWPWWIWALPAITATGVALIRAVGHMQTSSKVKAERAEWAAQWIAELESRLATAVGQRSEAATSIRSTFDSTVVGARRLAQIMNVPEPQGSTLVEVYGSVLSAVNRKFNAAFAANPAWGFPDYVPFRRAQVGDLTRVDSDMSVPDSAGMGAGVKQRRMVKKLGPDSYSDLAFAFQASQPALQ